MRFLRCAAPFTLVAFAIAPPAAAGEVYGHGPILGAVTAVSLYGNGSITHTETRRSVIRSGCRTGPGSTAGQVARSLRVQTVDMFARENQMGGYGTLQQECGILGCLHRSFTVPF